MSDWWKSAGRAFTASLRDRNQRHTLVCLALSALAALWCGFGVLDARVAGLWVRHAGYYVVALVFAWWCLALVRELARGLPDRDRVARREVWHALLLCLGLTLVAVCTAPYAYKVLFDEHVLQTTAWNLHMEREVGALGRAYVLEGLLRSVEVYLDKRPVLFAFLVSLTHDLTGYREVNAFLLNSALYPLIITLAYVLGRRLGGHGAGLAAGAALGAFTLLALNATGAGMEMVNLALVLFLMWAGARHLERPDERSAALLALTGVMLAYARYESALYVASTGVLLILGWARAGRPVAPAALLATPLLLLPCAWHNVYLSGTPFLWELRDGYEARFAVEYLRENLAFAADYFFARDAMIANSLWLTFAGGAAAFVCLGLAARDWARGDCNARPVSVATAWVAAGAVGNLALLMAYYWGDLSDPIVSRLALPFHAVLALAIAAVIGRLPRAWRGRGASIGVAGALLVYVGVHLPVNQRISALNTIGTALEWEREVLARRGPGERLIVSDKSPLAWFVRETSSTSIARLARRSEGVRFHLQHGSFDEIIVTQTLRPLGADGGFAVVPGDRLPPRFVLEPIAERRIGARLQRMSVLRGILPDEMEASAPLESSTETAATASSP